MNWNTLADGIDNGSVRKGSCSFPPMTSPNPFNLIVILGPTASGKTRAGVRLATQCNGEIISADSRQLFRGMDIGTGKDLDEYGDLPYHLIDIREPGEEFSLFTFMNLFTAAWQDITGRGRLPFLVGGTGLYLDAVLRGYRLTAVPANPELRAELALLGDQELQARLCGSGARLHNTTDLLNRDRLIRAIEIAEAPPELDPVALPQLMPLVFGIRWDREVLRRRIAARLKERLQQGMVDEVERLLASGVSAETLEFYGLEYRFIVRHLRGELNRNDMTQKLTSAINDFAKRQENWFRRMERDGVRIIWVDGANHPEVLMEEYVIQQTEVSR